MSILEPVAATPAPDNRDPLCGFIVSRLLGPLSGPKELLTSPPTTEYILGVLYPQDSTPEMYLSEEEIQELNADSGVGADSSADDDAEQDSSVVITNDWLPSSLGISFFTDAKSVECQVWGAYYALEGLKKWRRHPIADPASPEAIRIDRPTGGRRGDTTCDVLGGRAQIKSTWRPLPSGALVTVTVVNARQMPKSDKGSKKDRKEYDEACLHQVGFRCKPIDGVIPEYASTENIVRDDEDEELKLMYRSFKVFAVGHGCSVTWPTGSSDTAEYVQTEYVPRYDVSPLTYDLQPPNEEQAASYEMIRRVLHLPSLLSMDKGDFLRHAGALVDAYEAWMTALLQEEIPKRYERARERIVEDIHEAIGRMRGGITLLGSSDVAFGAFILANQAMLMQRYRTKVIIDDRVHTRDRMLPSNISYQSYDYSWRPFQFAFQLLTIESISNESSPDRDIVDLIWFPTGGGKTEAYLAVAAYLIFLRRLREARAGAGTAVITRYTLTLLTAQQFQRAATMICACEMLRAKQPSKLGADLISIGLWIGKNSTPNTTRDAHEEFQKVLESDEPSNPFQLHQCPWCGTEILPRAKSRTESYGIRTSEDSFEFFCPNNTCDFHASLPVQIVDEELYRTPPTFLLGTVDKFAALAWEDRPAAFFGSTAHRPPSLIIQDELHLLSGPLGTTVGIYEAAIETLISLWGGKPKIIASTATIRRASDQILGLFGRNRTNVFPAPGVNSNDSFFARTDAGAAGRRYLGVMPQSTSSQTSLINTACATLQSVNQVPLNDETMDAYWTLIAYHNSIRELGRTINLARADIPDRLGQWCVAEPDLCRDINEDNVIELRSGIGSDQLPAVLQQLKTPRGDDGCLSIVACTNMFSVGVDVTRLGIMLVNGQPKSTSEYIQSTSRVGRGHVPGVVVVLYSSTRPRDRSHYEQFVSYHSTLYKRVEPTSVTPFSPPSRARALHAAYVILMRNWGGLSRDDQAGSFRATDPNALRTKEALLARVAVTDPSELTATEDQLTTLMEEWEAAARTAIESKRYLYYKPAGKSQSNLLKYFGKSGTGWPTLTSMRNVDVSCSVWVLGEGEQK